MVKENTPSGDNELTCTDLDVQKLDLPIPTLADSDSVSLRTIISSKRIA